MVVPTPLPRLAAIAGIVFLANAGLLVLQLATARLLVPYIGSSLETWTSIIGVYLAGIALGNARGGPLADRSASPRTAARYLLYGALAAGWLALFPRLLAEMDGYRVLPLSLRIPVLVFMAGFPAGYALSLLTPLAIKLGLRDLRQMGRASGRIFALGTLGSLFGNYITGFYLIPSLTVDAIVLGTGASLLLLAGLVAMLPGQEDAIPQPLHAPVEPRQPAVIRDTGMTLSLPRACLIVFVCSFAGMALELTASRVLAQVIGVSLYTWTGVIGVMLAGTACGNWLGGILADRDRAGSMLAPSLVLASVAVVGVLIGFFLFTHLDAFAGLPLVTQVLAWTFALFFGPMLLLGTISPQVIRLATPDVGFAGRVAGRVYACSTAGAIAGTFAAGYVLVSTAGMYRTILGVALLSLFGVMLTARWWERRSLLYIVSIVLGTALAGFALLTPENTRITRETNYFTLTVIPDPDRPDVLQLKQDLLVHSKVRLHDPAFLHYVHEQVQMEFVRMMRPEARVLVIGGGGYTFPRAAKSERPGLGMDVVEIDAEVTALAYSHLGLDPALGIRSFHRDGRQFLAELAPLGHYDLITLDAVNDLSVPYHLLTHECNLLTIRALAPGGVYLVTVIDDPVHGRLWSSAMATLRQSFAHVELLTTQEGWPLEGQTVLVLYAADEPLDLERLRASTRKPFQEVQAAAASTAGAMVQPRWFTQRPPGEEIGRIVQDPSSLILRDQYAPVDYLMANIFRQRKMR